MNLEKLERFRLKSGPMASPEGAKYGFFFVRLNNSLTNIKVMCSPMGEGEWEHVSVSLQNRCPTWDEMCQIKALFWDPEDTVIQLHPPQSEWINNSNFCLHLWRNRLHEQRLPPSIFVGIKELGVLA